MEVRVRQAIEADIAPISKALRKIDRLEMALVSMRCEEDALADGFRKSDKCFTVEIEGKPAAMFGVCKYGVLGDDACIWFLGTNDIKRIKKTFVKQSRIYIEEFYKIGVCRLDNYVWIHNRWAIKWLKWLGARFDKPQKYGFRGKRFVHFYLEKGEL